jgi:hypothetical protein
MNTGPPGAPERAGYVPEARYGMRWRARDAWRGFVFLLAREPWYGVFGLALTAVGVPLLAFALTVPEAAPGISQLRQEAGAAVAAGLVLTAVAHRGTLLAQWRGRRGRRR